MSSAATGEEKEVTLNKLTPEEESVIVAKGTERPFSGKYDKHDASGTYICKQCNSPLYRSADKFDSRCGWPSFDDEIDGAVKRIPDADGLRTEVVCARCDGHLGHVFLGELLTDKDTRHCVNSISLGFVLSESEVATDVAYFAGGCFWGTEYLLQQQEGVISTEVGFMGGSSDSVSYEEVCSGTSGHTETVRVQFDPTKTDYETLTKFFFEIHDPTQMNRQGPDIGSQYRSAVFVTDNEQRQTVEKLIDILRAKKYDIVTEIATADKFWMAEDYHQDYYKTSGKQPYCHIYQRRF
ncbi:MAG: bifunctional methionine sulfoxide reductase B/A protein [candidate division Zixibacteria bacterium]